MNLVSRTLSGGIMALIGVVLVAVSPFVGFVSLIYGIPLFIIGLFILFNTKEDKIEQIKFRGGKK